MRVQDPIQQNRAYRPYGYDPIIILLAFKTVINDKSTQYKLPYIIVIGLALKNEKGNQGCGYKDHTENKILETQ